MENKEALLTQYNEFKKKALKLDMSRGKPSTEQLDTVEAILSVVSKNSDCYSEGKIDCRNYGVLSGISEAKKLFSDILDVTPDEIIIGGNSSLNLMYDSMARAMLHGVYGSERPWSKYEKISFLCPVPGYDRHFAICEYFGINMINIPMNSDGPDMDMIERYIADDETVKGIWCVPKYSNPSGITYSDEVVKRFAQLKPKAKDFRVFWDNAYVLHDLTSTPDTLLNVLKEAEKYGNENMFYVFASTSKITYSGSGIAAIAASKANIERILQQIKVQTIGYDKINMLRTVRLFPTLNDIKKQMNKHMSLIRPKFEVVLEAFKKHFSNIDNVVWTNPNGGYFICLTLPRGCAKRTVELAKEAGLIITSAGAMFPYGVDPDDRVLRIAPTYPSLEELKYASELLCCAVKMAINEKYPFID